MKRIVSATVLYPHYDTHAVLLVEIDDQAHDFVAGEKIEVVLDEQEIVVPPLDLDAWKKSIQWDDNHA
jgi:hypothetical protein